MRMFKPIAVGLLFTLVAAPNSQAEPGPDWVQLPANWISATGTKIYVHEPSIEEPENGVFFVYALSVYEHTIAGIDFFDSNGNSSYDTDYPHRSVLTHEVYDCNRGVSGTALRQYFSSDFPREDDLVFSERDDDLHLFPALEGDAVEEYICR